MEEYTSGPLDELRIDKVYQLSLGDDPSGIPTEDFTRNGRLYYLLDMVRKDEVGVDTQTHTETVTLASDTNKMDAILQRLESEMEFTTEDGYTGVLRLDHTSVQVATDGYASKTTALSATRTYPNLSDADVSLVPKTITDNGRTLNLADVQWSSTEGTDGEGGVVTHYTATADYSGTVTRIALNKVRYVAIFEGTPLNPVEPEPDPIPEASAGTDESSAPMFQFSWAYVLVPLGVVAAAGAGIGIALFIKERRDSGCETEEESQ